jgi:Bacterial regulatory helix-turn-helix protein, lysR family
MEGHQLRGVLAVAAARHSARAAARLHIDQSPLSRTIGKREEDLGAPWSARTTRSARLNVFDRQTDLNDDNLIDSDDRFRYLRPCSP